MSAFDKNKFEFYYKSFKNGNYYGVKPTDEAKEKIESIMKDLKLKEPVDVDDIHVTLMYSPDKGNPMIPPSDLEYKAHPSKFALFGDEKDCLVIKLESKDLEARHKELLATGFIHTYDDYKPHITLSYNYEGDIPDEKVLKDLGEMSFSSEYMQPIDENWK